ncbi:hypothetical protein [Caballeronia glathei]|uniref:hypothetical protein n=1 Tax=Caballeronia glathei TaxID=60547 RepID=UPI000B050629|nr:MULTISPECIES: hypothetical protein [Burkholderiaceae]
MNVEHRRERPEEIGKRAAAPSPARFDGDASGLAARRLSSRRRRAIEIQIEKDQVTENVHAAKRRDIAARSQHEAGETRAREAPVRDLRRNLRPALCAVGWTVRPRTQRAFI